MARAIGGVAFIKIDGDQHSTNGDFTINFQDRQATAVVGTNGEMFYTEEAVPSTISGTVFATPEINARTLVEARDVTVTVELNNGQVAVLSEAVFTGDASFSANSGEFDVEFSGKGKWLR